MKPYKTKNPSNISSKGFFNIFLLEYYEHDRTSLIFDERLDELEDVLIIVFIILLYILYFYSSFLFFVGMVGFEPTTL